MDELDKAVRELDLAAYACVGTLQSLRDCAGITGCNTIALDAINRALAKYDGALKAYRDARADAAKEAA